LPGLALLTVGIYCLSGISTACYSQTPLAESIAVRAGIPPPFEVGFYANVCPTSDPEPIEVVPNNGGSWKLVSIKEANHGRVRIISDQAIEYTPFSNTLANVDDIVFTMSDASGTTASGTAHLRYVRAPATGPFPYPLIPGTTAWRAATVEERFGYSQIPDCWLAQASSWQIFCSVVGHPYFKTIFLPGSPLGKSYASARWGLVSVLKAVDHAPDFGVNMLRYMEGLDIHAIAPASCGDAGFCGIDYLILCYMAGMDSCLNTMGQTPSAQQANLQKLFRLAVWDAADCCSSTNTDFMAGGPIQLIYKIYGQPETVRGTFPTNMILPLLSEGEVAHLGGGSMPLELIPLAGSIKTAFGLTARP